MLRVKCQKFSGVPFPEAFEPFFPLIKKGKKPSSIYTTFIWLYKFPLFYQWGIFFQKNKYVNTADTEVKKWKGKAKTEANWTISNSGILKIILIKWEFRKKRENEALQQ